MSAPGPRQDMPQQDALHHDLERFRELVLRDLALQEQLREPADANSFVALVLQLGRERGFAFTESDVNGAMQAGRRVWIERWIQ
jgi:Nif11 domain